MGKTTIHCVRHAQGFHNLSVANHSIHDPDLTPFGEIQCETLAVAFPTFFSTPPEITHLISSPLRRTLYTCLLSFPNEAKQHTIIALPELQETSSLPCDTGSDIPKLTQEFGSKVDLSLLQPDWNSKTGKWSPASSAIEARAREARLWLRSLANSSTDEDVNIVVVTHGGYLHYLTEDWAGHTIITGTGWANTEVRSFEFMDVEDEDAALVETMESRERRRGSEIMLTRDEQRELRASAEREGIEKGYVNKEPEVETKL